MPLKRFIDGPGHVGGKNPCFFCGREIVPGNEAGLIHIGAYGDILLARGEDDPGSLGLFPLGSDCIEKVPKEYRYPANGA